MWLLPPIFVVMMVMVVVVVVMPSRGRISIAIRIAELDRKSRDGLHALGRCRLRCASLRRIIGADEFDSVRDWRQKIGVRSCVQRLRLIGGRYWRGFGRTDGCESGDRAKESGDLFIHASLPLFDRSKLCCDVRWISVMKHDVYFAVPGLVLS
jgi:hypothetical protein